MQLKKNCVLKLDYISTYAIEGNVVTYMNQVRNDLRLAL